jgi:hypothetical protein
MRGPAAGGEDSADEGSEHSLPKEVVDLVVYASKIGRRVYTRCSNISPLR